MPIEVKNLCFSYDKKAPVLKNINLSLSVGELVGIIGQTGCGKSTLAQVIAGLEKPDSGSVFLDGEDIFSRKYDRSVLRSRLGMVFQYPEAQLFEQSVERDVAFGLKNSWLGKAEGQERVKWALELMGLDYEAVRGLSPLALSGGEKRRVAIAGVLAVKPEYLILDEPIAGLDPLSRDGFMKTLSGLCAQGVCVIMISHNCDCLAEYASRIVAIQEGEIVFDGLPNALFSNTAFLAEMRLGGCNVKEIVNALGLPDEILKYNDLVDEIVKKYE